MMGFNDFTSHFFGGLTDVQRSAVHPSLESDSPNRHNTVSAHMSISVSVQSQARGICGKNWYSQFVGVSVMVGVHCVNLCFDVRRFFSSVLASHSSLVFSATLSCKHWSLHFKSIKSVNST